MTTFNITGDGGAENGGCAVITTEFSQNLTLAVGDTAYLLYKAVLGVLEKIVIREVLVEPYIIKYIDTLNAVYLDSEVVDEATAIALAETYHENRIAQTKAYIDSLCS